MESEILQMYPNVRIRTSVSKEEVDNAVPQWALEALKDHPSFHGSIPKVEAVTKLVESGRNCYLTRYSNFHNSCIISAFQISESGEERLQHIKLDIPQGSDVSELLKSYRLGDCLQSNIWRSSIDPVSNSKWTMHPFQIKHTLEKPFCIEPIKSLQKNNTLRVGIIYKHLYESHIA